MRNAILQADLNRGFGDRDRIWAVFAARGMGCPRDHHGRNDTSPVQDFSLPAGRRRHRRRRRRRQHPPRSPGCRSRASASRSGRPSTFTFTLSEAPPPPISIDKAEAVARRVAQALPRRRSGRCASRPRCTRYVAVGSAGQAEPAAGRPARALQRPGRLAGAAAGRLPRDDRRHRPGRQPLARRRGDVPDRSPLIRTLPRVEDWLTAAARARPDHVALVADDGR